MAEKNENINVKEENNELKNIEVEVKKDNESSNKLFKSSFMEPT